MSLSVPGTTMIPQPETKLPNRSAQRTWARGAAGSAAAPAAVTGGPSSSSSMDLERLGVDDGRRVAADEVDDVAEGRLEVELVAVLLDVADVRRADGVLEAQQQVALEDRLALEYV